MSERGKYLTAGALAGVLNGLLGAGGGLALAPLYIRWAKMEEKTAMATGVMVIAPLCLLSAGIYALRGHLDLAAAWPYLAGGLAGGLIAGWTFQKLSSTWLRRLFGALLLLGGARMLLYAG
jgi:uncharacterized membrane protein YfcA